ncbi:site-specific integrase, partial [Salinicola sp. V024]|uniref:site-specific integrase n=1 Tax=Salinicola sp. V024 TaxID=3459609 RepID=UPI0040442318
TTQAASCLNSGVKDRRFLLIRHLANGGKITTYADVRCHWTTTPHLYELIVAAHSAGFKRRDQLFNVNRFSQRHKRTTMDTWQVERFFQSLSELAGYKMSPHRFRHFLGTSLMDSPERNIHLTQNILNHTDIRTTMEYVHPDVEAMRRALNARPPV